MPVETIKDEASTVAQIIITSAVFVSGQSDVVIFSELDVTVGPCVDVVVVEESVVSASEVVVATVVGVVVFPGSQSQ